MARPALKLIKDMEDEVFEGLKPQPVRAVYMALCERLPLIPIRTERQHRAAAEMVERLISFIPEHEGASGIDEMRDYLSTLSKLVADFESEKYASGEVSPAKMLAYLMEQHGLKQVDLKDELGGQSVVSEILNGKRELNANQIRALAKRFNVSPAVFL